MAEINIGGMRPKVYKSRNELFLEKDLVAKEPIGQFKAWFEDACDREEIQEPNAMCLATTSRDGQPSARYVLCKGYGKDGFKFYTNYESRKGRDIDYNPNVAVTFYWEVLHRSVRIEGRAEQLSEKESIEYFQTRPIQSQISACASYQSSAIDSREFLYRIDRAIEKDYLRCGKDIPKPAFWGGYIIRPKSIEFWQGQTDRLHDRIRFRKPACGEIPDGKLLHQGEDGWVYERLAP